MANSLGRIKEQFKELGFGTRGFKDAERLINRDGSFNVDKTGRGIQTFSLYHWLINLSWLQFFLFVMAAYVFLNLIFAFIYFVIGPDQISDHDTTSSWGAFFHCFYFSSQTLTTVGFGRLNPIGHWASIVASFEAMVGLLSFAFATGILYGRFSKAKAKILFSDNILVSPYRGIKGLKFRIVNMRKNHLIEMQAKVIYSYLEYEGQDLKRRYKQLPLELDFINMFPLPWTIVHPIEEKSPLYGKGIIDLSKEEAEFIVILKGYDDTFNQYVHQTFSYRHDEVVFDSNFVPMFDAGGSGKSTVYLNKISDYQKTVL
ncbi:MAG: ion channel [bacterium]|nr:ion channel [bacterium]